MRYQPNFCSNCGEKIERPTPSVTDSTRFCDICKHDFVLLRFAPVVFTAVMALIGIFGIGAGLGGGGESRVKIASRQAAADERSAAKNPSSNAPAANSGANVSRSALPNVAAGNVPAASPNLPVKPPARQAATVPAAQESVYFCGAATKKGAPCSRRVRGGGRCWQHKGQTALLADEKLLANQ